MAILRAVLAGTRVAEVSEVKLPEVMAVEEMASDAVTEPICAVPAPIVTEPAIVCVPVGLAVTVPAIVTVFPTVTVPEMGIG